MGPRHRPSVQLGQAQTRSSPATHHTERRRRFGDGGTLMAMADQHERQRDALLWRLNHPQSLDRHGRSLRVRKTDGRVVWRVLRYTPYVYSLLRVKQTRKYRNLPQLPRNIITYWTILADREAGGQNMHTLPHFTYLSRRTMHKLISLSPRTPVTLFPFLHRVVVSKM